MSALPNLKNKIAIILAGIVDIDLRQYLNSDYYVIAVDGGFDHLQKLQLDCDILIGDMDSVENNSYSGAKICYDSVKDDTDFVCSINHAKQYNPNGKIEVFGFASLNRIDHVITNLSVIEQNMTFISNNQQIIVLEGDCQVVEDEYVYYSFYALTPIRQFSLSGFKYPLFNYQLNPFDPLCVSNELNAKCAKIEISNGKVICIKSKKN